MAVTTRQRPPFPQGQGTGMFSSAPPPQFGFGGNQNMRPLGPQSDFAGEPDYNSRLFDQRQELDAKRLRKSIYRKTVDYFTPVVKYLEERSVFVDPSNFRDILSDQLYYSEMLPCVGYPRNASNAITSKFIRQATNKIKCPVFVVLWTPEGRRLVTGSSSGEFTLWNGLTFNFETILQAIGGCHNTEAEESPPRKQANKPKVEPCHQKTRKSSKIHISVKDWSSSTTSAPVCSSFSMFASGAHDTAVRSMVWSRSDTWLVTGDASGYIKYWQANMNNVKSYQAHRDSIRGISFCPTDFKFATGSDDGTIRIWDFETCETLKVLRGGHGGEVKCVDWHPKKSLLVTGSRDNQQPIKLWDPRTADPIGTLYLHKGPVTDLKWNPINSNYLLSSSRDSLVKLFDLRTMKDFQTCRGHKREVMSVAWHPIFQTHFCSGGMDGSLLFWSVGTDREVGTMENAHDGSIWSMSWHPQGHILCTGSNDCSVKFWTRNRPGDTMKDKYNAQSRSETENPLDLRGRSELEFEEEEEETVAEAAFTNYDSQDITEFESNVVRSARPPDAPPHFAPPLYAQNQQPFRPPVRPGGLGHQGFNVQQPGPQQQQFDMRDRPPPHRPFEDSRGNQQPYQNQNRFPPPQPHNQGSPEKDGRSYRYSGAEDRRNNDNQFAHYDDRTQENQHQLDRRPVDRAAMDPSRQGSSLVRPPSAQHMDTQRHPDFQSRPQENFQGGRPQDREDQNRLLGQQSSFQSNIQGYQGRPQGWDPRGDMQRPGGSDINPSQGGDSLRPAAPTQAAQIRPSGPSSVPAQNLEQQTVQTGLIPAPSQVTGPAGSSTSQAPTRPPVMNLPQAAGIRPPAVNAPQSGARPGLLSPNSASRPLMPSFPYTGTPAHPEFSQNQPVNRDERRENSQHQEAFGRENWERQGGLLPNRPPDNQWRGENDGPPPRDYQGRNDGHERSDEPPRGGLLPPPAQASSAADDFRTNKRPWDDPFQSGGERGRGFDGPAIHRPLYDPDRQPYDSERPPYDSGRPREAFDDNRGSRPPFRSGGRAGRGRGTWRGR